MNFFNKIFNYIYPNFNQVRLIGSIGMQRDMQGQVLKFLTFSSIQLFYIALLLLSSRTSNSILSSYIMSMLSIVIIIGFRLIKWHVMSNVALLLSVYAGIVFFEIYLGSAVTMGVYYFPIVFLGTRLFQYKEHKVLTVAFIILPIILYLITSNYFSTYYDRTILSSKAIKILRTFNIVFALMLIGLFTVYELITSNQREEKLTNDYLALQSLIDNTKASLWSINTNYEIIAANAQYSNAMKNIFGYDIVPGFNLKILLQLTTYPQLWRQYTAKVLQGISFFDEYEENNNFYEIHAAPILKNIKQVIGAVFYVRNITERRESELKIATTNTELAKAVVAKEQFLSNMSHELRTPLNGITGLTNILISSPYLPSQKEHLDMLKYSADHMLDLVNDILDYNKIAVGKVQLESTSFHLKTLVEKVVLFFVRQANEKGIKLEVTFNDAESMHYYGDVVRLRQVLNNLISNAIKFTYVGTVHIAIQVHNLSNNKANVAFSIQDTGIGIPEGKIENIFNSFSQADVRINRKYGGTGLGLTISAKLVQLMGSSITVVSTENVGSTFAFELQLPIHYKAVSQANEVTTLQPFNNVKALIVEDNAINRLVINNFLKKWNIETTLAENGAVALEYALLHKYDIILMDLEMPVMDGITAVEHIRYINKNIPIIAITAGTGNDLRSTLFAKGFNDFVPKPFAPEQLHLTISNLLYS